MIDNYGFRMVATPATYAAAAAYGLWVNMVGFRRVTFMMGNGELDSDMTFKVYEATSAAGANAQEVDTVLRNTFANGTHEGYGAVIEVLADNLTDGYPYVTIQATPGATDTYCCFAILGDPYVAPVSNANDATDKVAFADSVL
jgi:hypothetical protein